MNQVRRPEKTPREEAMNDIANNVRDNRELNIALDRPGTEPMSDEFLEVLDGAGLPPQRR